MVTIGIAPTSADPRLKHFVVALVHHTLVDGELMRKGAVTTVLPGKQSTDRAWFYGLRLIAHLSNWTRKCKYAWEAWVHGRRSDVFLDLNQLVTHDQRSRIRPLSLSHKQVNEMPPGPYTLKARFKDASKVAREIALPQRPEQEEADLRVTDQRYNKIAPLAIARIKHLLETKDYFLHQVRESGRINRQKAKEKKAQLFQDIGQQKGERAHQWVAKTRGLQCHGCNKRITMHVTYAALQSIKEEECPATTQLSIKGGQAPKERSKADLLKSLLDGTYPELHGHSFVLQTNYLVCTGCNGRILRHAASEKIEGLAKSKCWNQEWIPDGSWRGHKSHKLWRKGGRVTCLNCKAQALPKDGSFEVSRNLRRLCGQTSSQHTLPTLFTSQNG